MDRPLAVTRDPLLADELSRLAAAAGVALAVLTSATEALSAWRSAPVVLVGADLADEVAALAPERRAGVQVVAWSPPPDGAFRDALLLGAEQVVELPVAAEWLAELLTDLGEAGRAEGVLVGVVGGSGGAGSTTLACGLGQVAGRAGAALVVDLDPLGPGCDRVLALDDVPGVRWDSLGRSSGRLSGRSLREAVPRGDGVGVLAWPPTAAAPPDPSAVREALSAGRRGHDLTIVDLPRSADHLVVETAARCRVVVVVVRPTVSGVASALRTAAALELPPARLGVVVRGGGGVDPIRVAEVVGGRLLAEMSDQRGLGEALDLGLGPVRSRRGPLARACRDVLGALSAPAVAA